MFVEDTMEDSKLWGIQKLGLYGIGGLGKTTLSRALCMFYFKHFNGRVFHVELGSRPPLDLQKLVLMKLLQINKDVVERVHTIHGLLKDHMSRQPVFLVIDNIINSRESQTEALAYLEAGFHLGSMIMITSRSLDIVEELFPSHPNAMFCKGVASLNKDEARLIFLQRAASERMLESLTPKELNILDNCLSQCHFSLVNGTRQYHPLALRALADYYHKHDSWILSTWREHLGDLDKLRLSNASSGIFGILGLQFWPLAWKEKLMFLNLCLYTKFESLSNYTRFFVSVSGWRQLGDTLSWLVDMHEGTPRAIESQLRSLKRSGILNITSGEDGVEFFTIHDLYLEFAEWYVIDGEGSRWCVYHAVPTSRSAPGNATDSLPYILKRTSPSACEWQRIRLQNLKCATFPSKKVQEWCYVVVLQIHGCSHLEVLDLDGLSCLRHLELVGLPELESFLSTEPQPPSVATLVSLQHVVLESLKSLKQIPDFSLCRSLKAFRMLDCEEFLRKPPRFVGCSQLEDLQLHWNWQWRLEDFKLHTLTSLTSLWLHSSEVWAFCESPSLSVLERWGVHELAGLEACTQLRKLVLYALPITSLQGLEKLRKLQQMEVSFCGYLRDIPDVPAELNRLWMWGGAFTEFPGVERLLQLKSLRFLECEKLTSLPDLDHLPNLTWVQLDGCQAMQVRPRVRRDCSLFSHKCRFDER